MAGDRGSSRSRSDERCSVGILHAARAGFSHTRRSRNGDGTGSRRLRGTTFAEETCRPPRSPGARGDTRVGALALQRSDRGRDPPWQPLWGHRVCDETWISGFAAVLPGSCGSYLWRGPRAMVVTGIRAPSLDLGAPSDFRRWTCRRHGRGGLCRRSARAHGTDDGGGRKCRRRQHRRIEHGPCRRARHDAHASGQQHQGTGVALSCRWSGRHGSGCDAAVRRSTGK